MRLIAGLGNPGQRYINTRHNAGFRIIDELARRNNLILKKRPFGKARQIQFSFSGERLILIQPLTFMNLSGRCIVHYAKRYNISPENILIICDDINLPLGELRIRPQGGAGGHRGLESVIKALKTEVFPRLRVGIGPEGYVDNFQEFVLSDFKGDEIPGLDEIIHRGAEACTCWLKEGIDKAMNVYNK